MNEKEMAVRKQVNESTMTFRREKVTMSQKDSPFSIKPIMAGDPIRISARIVAVGTERSVI